MYLKLGRSATLASMMAALALAACAGTNASAPADTAVSQSDLRFITTLYNIDEFDRQAAGVEIARGSDPRVRTLAEQILTGADNFRAKVKPISDAAGIQPPTTLTFQERDPQTSVADLIGQPSYDIDRAFLSDEIAAHKLALARRDAMAEEAGGNAELKSLATSGAAQLRSNLAQMDALQIELKSTARLTQVKPSGL